MHQTNSVIFNVAHGAWLFQPRTLSMCESHIRDLHELGSSAPWKHDWKGLKHRTNLPRSLSSAILVTDRLKMNSVNECESHIRDLHVLGHPNLFNDRRCARMDDRLRASFSFSQRFAHSGLLTKTPVWYQTLYTFALNLLVVRDNYVWDNFRTSQSSISSNSRSQACIHANSHTVTNKQ